MSQFKLQPTVGLDFKRKTLMVPLQKKQDALVTLQIWDTAGLERFRAVTTSYYHGAMGVVVVYDIGDEASFNNARTWADQVNKHGVKNISKVLIGNKADTADSDRKVTAAQGKALAEELGYTFIETSTYNNTNVKSAIDDLAATIAQNLANNPKYYGTPTSTSTSGSSTKCCVVM
jgi:small GTP-binding protein